MLHAGAHDRRDDVRVFRGRELVAEHRLVDVRQIAAELVDVDAIAIGRPHRDHHPGELGEVARGEGHEIVRDLLPSLSGEPPHDPEVEEPDAPVVERHEVSGVHIAVEEAVQDHALEPRSHPDEETLFGVATGGPHASRRRRPDGRRSAP